MNDKEKVQELATQVLKLEWLCKEGETDDEKLEKQLSLTAKLARECCCAQYDPAEDDNSLGC